MSQRSLTFKDIVFYGLPGLPLAMLGLPLFIYLPSFYSQDLGLSLTAVGLALLLARSFDVITDPLIGFLNDRYPKIRSITWRRKSFMLLGLPLLLIGLNYLLKPIDNVTPFYLFIWSFITYLGWTLINIPWLAMGAEMSRQYHDKSDLASSREVFSAIGTVVVIIIPVLLISDTAGKSEMTGTLSTLANVLLILIPVTLIPLMWKVSINEELHVNNSNAQKHNTNQNDIKESSFLASFKRSFKQFYKDNLNVVKHPAIKRILPAYFLNSVANALPATLFILYVNFVLQTPDQVGILLITYFLSAILGIPFWLYLARKIDKTLSWRVALYGSIATFIWVPFIGQGDFIPFLIVCFVSGFCLGADVVMPSSIQADISQSFTETNNKNTKTVGPESQENETNPTGLLFGIWGMLTKLSLAIAIGISFPLLDLVGLQINEATQVSPSSLGTATLVILYALIPVILKILVVIRMKNFPFDQSYFETKSSLQSHNFKRGYTQ